MLKPVPEKGRDATRRGRTTDPAERNRSPGEAGSVSHPSRAERKGVSPEPLRKAQRADACPCDASSPTFGLLASGTIVPIGELVEHDRADDFTRHNSRRESPPAERSEQAGTWRWVGAVGFRVDGYGGRPDGSAGPPQRCRVRQWGGQVVRSVKSDVALLGPVPPENRQSGVKYA